MLRIVLPLSLALLVTPLLSSCENLKEYPPDPAVANTMLQCRVNGGHWVIADKDHLSCEYPQ